jgi:hypothetical protein
MEERWRDNGVGRTVCGLEGLQLMRQSLGRTKQRDDMTGAQVLAGAAAGVGALIAGEQGLYFLRELWSREWERADGQVLDSRATQGFRIARAVSVSGCGE